MSVEAPFKTQAEMMDFIGRSKATMEQVQGQAERLQAIELLSTQLRAGLDAMKGEKATASQIQPVGTDAEVVRSFYSPGASSSDMDVNAVVDTRQRAVRVDAEEGNTHIGNDHGLVRLFGSADECGVWEDGLLDDPNPKSEWQRGLQRRFEALALVRAAKGKLANTRKLMKGIQRHISRGPAQISKVFADNAGEGGEWIVSIPLTQLERTAEMIRVVEAALPSMVVSGGNTFTHPFLTTGVQAFLHGIPAPGDLNPGEAPKSVPTTAERTISIKTLLVSVPVDMDASEDSIVDAFGQFNDLVARAEVDATEDALINGDSTATHGDTAFATWNPRSRWQTLGSSVDHRKAWIGFRHRAIDASAHTDKNAAQGPANMLAFLASMTQPHGLGDLIGITSPEHYIAKILTDANVLTVDKYGPSATLLTGEVARIGGRPLLISEFVTADLAASGLFTGSGALTSFIWVNRSRFRMVRRRSFRVNIDNQYTRHTSYVVASSRKTLHTVDPTATKNVLLAFNMSSS